eukprot:TRINITY_DN306_c0_g1_i1.p1 TRINITY_DN306_c0_g1~~TRINITY_DN306_c0_g1_i1.p1  ORF type:complete len:190 (+),score=49.93 TRINITY_DN306_c0_g1_i1:67-570(+)
MALTSREPFSELRQMQRDMDRTFDRFFLSGRQGETGGWDLGTDVRGNELGLTTGWNEWRPTLDLTDIGNEFLLHCELPGVEKGNINVDVRNNNLCISGERNERKKTEGERHITKERFWGKFCRTMPLPHGINPNDIKGEFRDGVLELRIPKPAELKEKESGHKIMIK